MEILKTVEKTQEEINKEIANTFVEKLNKVVGGTDNRIKGLAQEFWANPVIIAEQLGSNGVKLFQLLGALEEMLSTYVEDYQKFEVPYEYTIGEDGVITIGDKIEVEEVTEV